MYQAGGRTLRRTRGRQRFYSSMSYNDYCDFFGPPPTPKFQPLGDPEDIPQLVLEDLLGNQKHSDKDASKTRLQDFQLDPIQQIDGSQNQTVNGYLSPRKKLENFNDSQQRQFKRSHSRMRIQSENSQYLIFNFLDRCCRKPIKKIKC